MLITPTTESTEPRYIELPGGRVKENKPWGLEYASKAAVPAREIPIYDPFAPENKKESAEMYKLIREVNPNLRGEEEDLKKKQAKIISEGLPLDKEAARQNLSFAEKIDALIMKAKFEEALQEYNKAIAEKAPFIDELLDKAEAISVEVPLDRLVTLRDAVFRGYFSSARDMPSTNNEKAFVGLVKKVARNLSDEAHSLVLHRAVLLESMANELASMDYKTVGGRIVYSSQRASDMYYDSLTARLLVGFTLDPRKKGEQGVYPADYISEVQEKSRLKIMDLEQKAKNWMPGGLEGLVDANENLEKIAAPEESTARETPQGESERLLKEAQKMLRHKTRPI